MDRLTDSKERSNTATMEESSHSGIMCVYQLYPHRINKRRKNPKCSVGWREILERETHTSLEDRLQIWKTPRVPGDPFPLRKERLPGKG